MIPCVINNFNRLETTRKLVLQLTHRGYRNIHILDNGSTREDLKAWYQFMSPFLQVHYLPNLGPRAIYDSGLIHQFEGWVAYTDSDIELNPHTPTDFIETMIQKAEKWNYTKAGLALQLDDIEPHHFGHKWKEWESKYWVQELEENVYHADVDTTFCVIRTEDPFQYRSIRLAGDYTAKHMPWYTSWDDLSKEELYYLENASDDSTYKRCYLEFKKQK